MIQSKSLAFVGGALAVSGALLVVACGDDDPAPGSTNNDAGSSSGNTPGSSGNPPTPNNPPPANGSDAGDAGDGGFTPGTAELGAECTTQSDQSTECASGVCRTFGGGSGSGGGAKQGTFCTITCTEEGDDDPACEAQDVFTGRCNNAGYCALANN